MSNDFLGKRVLGKVSSGRVLAGRVLAKRRVLRRAGGNQIEQLEQRQMMAATAVAFVRGPWLHVRGTAGDDAISVNTADGKTTVTINDQSFEFEAEAWKRLRVSSFAGNDTIDASTAVGEAGKLSYRFSLGRGDDVLTGTVAADVVLGDRGDDTFHGLEGGKDVFVGGAGSDTVHMTAAGRVRGAEQVNRGEQEVEAAVTPPIADLVAGPVGEVVGSPEVSRPSVGSPAAMEPTVVPFEWWWDKNPIRKGVPSSVRTVFAAFEELAAAEQRGEVTEWFAAYGVAATADGRLAISLQNASGHSYEARDLLISLGLENTYGQKQWSDEAIASLYGRYNNASGALNDLSTRFYGTIPISALGELAGRGDWFTEAGIRFEHHRPPFDGVQEELRAYLWYKGQSSDGAITDPKLFSDPHHAPSFEDGKILVSLYSSDVTSLTQILDAVGLADQDQPAEGGLSLHERRLKLTDEQLVALVSYLDSTEGIEAAVSAYRPVFYTGKAIFDRWPTPRAY